MSAKRIGFDIAKKKKKKKLSSKTLVKENFKVLALRRIFVLG